MSQVNIEDFINKHLVKVLWAIVIYFLMNLSTDFKEVKITLQQLLINQATIENRLGNLETNDKKQDTRLDAADERRENFYRTYKLTKKGEDE